MARRYRGQSADADLAKAVFGIACLFLLVLAFYYYTDRNGFWSLLGYGILGLIGFLALCFLFVWLKAKWKKLRATKISTRIKKAGLEEETNNFITRFGQGQDKVRNGSAWEYRGYKIDWHRMDEIIRDFEQKGVSLTDKEFYALLKHNIDERENKITLNSVQSSTRDFNELSGEGFEMLLQRLYEKMGYTVQHTGRTGDQGGDLVAMNGQERIIIQAKCYKNMSVGNDAVQQVVSAKSYYDCNKAVVITTSDFTKEAIELAKVTSVELVAKPRLQELLVEYLSESWN